MKPKNYTKMIALFVMILLMMQGFPSFAKDQGDFDELMTRIEELVDENKDKEAIPLVERAIELYRISEARVWTRTVRNCRWVRAPCDSP